jgi:hypothetical protein
MANDIFQKVLPSTIDYLRAAMDLNGVGVLHQCLSREFLEKVVEFVTGELAKTRGEYFSYVGSDKVAGSPLEELGRSPAFRSVLTGIYEQAMGHPGPQGDFLQVLRVLSGVTGLPESHKFHFDAYVVTALVPIIIPTGPEEVRGDLVMYPNMRSVRSSVLANLCEKVLLQNSVIASLLATPFVQRRLGAKIIPMQPGNIYVFWGYRSLHANRPCPTDSVRATALFHFANPHPKNFMVRIIEERHRRRNLD